MPAADLVVGTARSLSSPRLQAVARQRGLRSPSIQRNADRQRHGGAGERGDGDAGQWLRRSKDWIALAAAGAADRTYLQWTYVGAGVTNRTWTITMPTAAGTYEFRLFLNDGFTRGATSPIVTVDPSCDLSHWPRRCPPRAPPSADRALTLTVNGGGFVAQSVVRWNGNAGRRPREHASLQAAISAADIAAGERRRYGLHPGARRRDISAAEVFDQRGPVDESQRQHGSPGEIRHRHADRGAGGSGRDWLALASTSAPNTSYVQWVYVGRGATRGRGRWPCRMTAGHL